MLKSINPPMSIVLSKTGGGSLATGDRNSKNKKLKTWKKCKFYRKNAKICEIKNFKINILPLEITH